VARHPARDVNADRAELCGSGPRQPDAGAAPA
jgi:hypothetical protein